MATGRVLFAVLKVRLGKLGCEEEPAWLAELAFLDGPREGLGLDFPGCDPSSEESADSAVEEASSLPLVKSAKFAGFRLRRGPLLESASALGAAAGDPKDLT